LIGNLNEKFFVLNGAMGKLVSIPKSDFSCETEASKKREGY
jgi:hypothetical protein